MFAIVFTTRYLDIFFSFISVYNTVLKILFVLLSYTTVYFMYLKFKSTLQKDDDTLRLIVLVVPIAGLSFIVNHSLHPVEARVRYSFDSYAL
ncbi:unnamed protein product [Protopolystoma xenopodis]|uniref:Uncharacterized protein n=1 Tax=Protopolystoma xenopodis TaxID=117903 RepID=A0A3S5C2U6_9PLAT|nr:unnamed protein product [Protopolystoma xenopodis]